ncbi:MAG: hypothetical protein M3Q23_03875 [Actinomycetota bacterium]|nr:hypothetical protein [Actinomycetota bacterium]
MSTTSVLCDDCRLTSAAAALLAQVLRDLRRDRPTDPRWGADVCSSCGEVTGVFDDAEGWAFGTRAPVPTARSTEHQAFVWVA